MKNLILLANEFPYGSWEPYLETEIKYYRDFFDTVTIFSLQLRKEHKNFVRKIPNDFIYYPVDYANKIKYILYFFIIIFDLNLYKELIKLMKLRKMNFTCVSELLIYLSRSHYEKNKILKILKKKFNYDDNALLYSYRFEYQPYVAILIKKKFKKFKIVTRAHRYDLYEEENRSQYIPMREKILNTIDKLYLISEDGYNYVNEKYPGFSNKLVISRLGTLDFGETDTKLGETLNIVSCSNIVPVKRLDKLIDALSAVTDISIYWAHFGVGILESEIKKMANSKLKGNICFDFKGSFPNSELMKEYKKSDFHVFINVSSSEGIPVSIMEALSFGIPCVATDVGGTKEIIKDSINGYLLKMDFSSTDLIKAINSILNMTDDEYESIKKRSRESWECNYSAESCYRSFLKSLREIYE